MKQYKVEGVFTTKPLGSLNSWGGGKETRYWQERRFRLEFCLYTSDFIHSLTYTQNVHTVTIYFKVHALDYYLLY